MTASVIGRISWGASRTKEGGREYSLKTRVLSGYDDGPHDVMHASGLPTIGSYWSFGGDSDPWAFCTPEVTVTPMVEGEPNRLWVVEQKFATPTAAGGSQSKRCQDTSIEDPLLEPPKISGSFAVYQREAKTDRFGSPIQSSSLEDITGVMKDDSRPSVVIEWNSAVLDLPWLTNAIHTLNDRPMWGMEKRKIKLSSVSWSRLVYGVCSFYYTKRLEFDVRFGGFDFTEEGERIMDVGYKCLRGRWIPPGSPTGTGTATTHEWTWEEDATANRFNPGDFIRARDPFEDPAPQKIPLDGFGGRLTDPLNPVFLTDGFELYGETNFLAYGIPSTL